jgi:hypothetical protein
MKNFIALPSRARVIRLSTTWSGRAGRHAIQPNRGDCGRHSLKTKGRFGQHIIKAALFLAVVVVAPNFAQAQITGRIVPSPIVGVTFDDVSQSSAEANALTHIARSPSVRVVFDTGEPASYYLGPIKAFNPVAYVMGELMDSSYACSYSVASITSFTQSYTATLGTLVDIWEVGNEVNGSWLCNGGGSGRHRSSGGAGSVMQKVGAMYDTVTTKGGRTALTFFYEGEPSDPNNCIDTSGGGDDMFSWISTYFLDSPTAETEKIRTGLNYVLVSWYPDQCPLENPNWPVVYTKLGQIFPNARVGFGELGTADPQNGSAFEINEINTIYPMRANVAGLPANYIGGVFWWYAAEEMVPWPGSLGATLNAAIAGLP